MRSTGPEEEDICPQVQVCAQEKHRSWAVVVGGVKERNEGERAYSGETMMMTSVVVLVVCGRGRKGSTIDECMNE